MGKIDAVYHVAFGPLQDAVSDYKPGRSKNGEPSQKEHWDTMVGLGRLRDYGDLAQGILEV